jgi:hypothetical protein
VTSCTVPAGAGINSSTGAFSWTPSDAQGPGTYRFKVVVTDNGSPNLSVNEEITVTVNEVNAAPTLTSPGNQSIVLGDTVSFTLSATDPDLPANTLTYSISGGSLSGMSLNSGTGAFSWTPTSGQVGPHTVTFRVTDNGSPAMYNEQTITITVSYVFTGFFQPVDNYPLINGVKAGSAIPVKFSLAGNQGLGILALGYPTSYPAACDASTPADTIEETLTAGNSSLTYDSTTGQYIYVWKTDKSWSSGSTPCRQLVVKFIDGTVHWANFKFTK